MIALRKFSRQDKNRFQAISQIFLAKYALAFSALRVRITQVPVEQTTTIRRLQLHTGASRGTTTRRVRPNIFCSERRGKCSAIIVLPLLFALPGAIFLKPALANNGAEGGEKSSMKTASGVEARKNTAENARTSSFLQYADKYAVVIGVDSFSDSSLNTALEIAESTKKVQNALLSQHFASDHIRLMLNRDATRQAVLSTVGSSWLGKLSSKNDLAFVFVAMQCFPANDGKVYLLPYDTVADNFFTTAIDVDSLLYAIKQNVKARETIVVFDTSFSGAPEMLAGCKVKFGRYNLSFEKTQLPPHLTVISSSKPSQPTWGTFFSDNLALAIKDEGASTSLAGLFARVRDKTIRDTIKDCAGCKRQSPVMYSKDKLSLIAIGGKAGDPREQMPADVTAYLSAENAYSKAQAVLDQCEATSRSTANSTAAQTASTTGSGTSNRPASRQIGSKSSGGSDGGTAGSGTNSSDDAVGSGRSNSDGMVGSGINSSGGMPGSANQSLNTDAVIRQLSEAIQKDPGLAPGHYMLGRLFECKTDFDSALNEYEKAVHTANGDSAYHGYLARALERAGRNPIEEWRTAYKLNNKNLEAIEFLASNSLDSGQIDKVIEFIEEGLSLYPGDAGLHVQLSDALKRKGQIQSALAHAQEAVSLDSNSFDALVNLGVLLMVNKDKKAAHTAFRQALEIGSSDNDDYYFLANEFEKIDDSQSAIAALEHFVKNTKKNDNRLMDAKTRLVELKKQSKRE